MGEISISGFFDFITTRQNIWYKREVLKLPSPWTDDPVLSQYHFCNVYRELDRGTQWFLRHCDDPLDSTSEGLWKAVFFRFLGLTTWFEALGEAVGVKGVPPSWLWADVAQCNLLVGAIHQLPKPYNPAYLLLAAPNRLPRVERLIAGLNDLYLKKEQIADQLANVSDLKAAHKAITRIRQCGPFVGMQSLRDLILLSQLPHLNEHDWCYIGPGARDALQRLGCKIPKEEKESLTNLALAAPKELQRRGFNRPEGLNYPNLCDIQHCLCEYGKYVKYRDNLINRKRRYFPGGPGLYKGER